MKLRGITVCVDYDDYLRLTLPYNAHHFRDFLVVTSPGDRDTQRLCSLYGVRCFVTDAFYRNGAEFNKYLALEEGLDELGRKGWIAVLDADILWPAEIEHEYEVGNIYTPFRSLWLQDVHDITDETKWSQAKHLNEHGCPGYTQIIHADDPHLQKRPWFEIDWRHAGGADTFFHERWPQSNWKRLPWRCLHLGQPFVNWCGRVTDKLDGQPTPDKDEKMSRLSFYHKQRQVNRDYRAEKL